MTNSNEHLTREVGVFSILLDKQAEKSDIYILYPSKAQL